MPGGIYLTESQLVVILVVQNVHQVCVERMHIVQLRELLYYLGESVVEVLLGEFHLATVERAYSRDLILLVNDRWCLSLRFR